MSGASSTSPLSPALTALRPKWNISQKGDFGGHTDADANKSRQWRRRHQRLDQPRHQQHTDQSDGHRDHGSALFGEHLPLSGAAHNADPPLPA